MRGNIKEASRALLISRAALGCRWWRRPPRQGEWGEGQAPRGQPSSLPEAGPGLPVPEGTQIRFPWGVCGKVFFRVSLVCLGECLRAAQGHLSHTETAAACTRPL